MYIYFDFEVSRREAALVYRGRYGGGLSPRRGGSGIKTGGFIARFYGAWGRLPPLHDFDFKDFDFKDFDLKDFNFILEVLQCTILTVW
jgi:hypothetical protein